MSERPDLRDLVGDDLPSHELERLRGVHELLLDAGPPPELSPALVEPARPSARVSAIGRRRWGVLALAASLVIAALVGGYVVGYERARLDVAYTVEMQGTPAAPNARASLVVGEKDAGGNWPMEMKVRGLAELPEGSYYELFLTKSGRPAASCGRFRVHDGTTTVPLNAPYRFKEFDRGGWVVLAGRAGSKRSPVVLRTVQSEA